MVLLAGDLSLRQGATSWSGRTWVPHFFEFFENRELRWKKNAVTLQLQGSISLTGAAVHPPSGTKHPFAFDLRVPFKETLYLRAASSRALEQWVSAFASAGIVNKYPAAVGSGASPARLPSALKNSEAPRRNAHVRYASEEGSADVIPQSGTAACIDDDVGVKAAEPSDTNEEEEEEAIVGSRRISRFSDIKLPRSPAPTDPAVDVPLPFSAESHVPASLTTCANAAGTGVNDSLVAAIHEMNVASFASDTEASDNLQYFAEHTAVDMPEQTPEVVVHNSPAPAPPACMQSQHNDSVSAAFCELMASLHASDVQVASIALSQTPSEGCMQSTVSLLPAFPVGAETYRDASDRETPAQRVCMSLASGMKWLSSEDGPSRMSHAVALASATLLAVQEHEHGARKEHLPEGYVAIVPADLVSCSSNQSNFSSCSNKVDDDSVGILFEESCSTGFANDLASEASSPSISRPPVQSSESLALVPLVALASVPPPPSDIQPPRTSTALTFTSPVSDSSPGEPLPSYMSRLVRQYPQVALVRRISSAASVGTDAHFSQDAATVVSHRAVSLRLPSSLLAETIHGAGAVAMAAAAASMVPDISHSAASLSAIFAGAVSLGMQTEQTGDKSTASTSTDVVAASSLRIVRRQHVIVDNPEATSSVQTHAPPALSVLPPPPWAPLSVLAEFAVSCVSAVGSALAEQQTTEVSSMIVAAVQDLAQIPPESDATHGRATLRSALLCLPLIERLQSLLDDALFIGTESTTSLLLRVAHVSLLRLRSRVIELSIAAGMDMERVLAEGFPPEGSAWPTELVDVSRALSPPAPQVPHSLPLSTTLIERHASRRRRPPPAPQRIAIDGLCDLPGSSPHATSSLDAAGSVARQLVVELEPAAAATATREGEEEGDAPVIGVGGVLRSAEYSQLLSRLDSVVAGMAGNSVAVATTPLALDTAVFPAIRVAALVTPAELTSILPVHPQEAAAEVAMPAGQPASDDDSVLSFSAASDNKEDSKCADHKNASPILSAAAHGANSPPLVAIASVDSVAANAASFEPAISNVHPSLEPPTIASADSVAANDAVSFEPAISDSQPSPEPPTIAAAVAAKDAVSFEPALSDFRAAPSQDEPPTIAIAASVTVAANDAVTFEPAIFDSRAVHPLPPSRAEPPPLENADAAAANSAAAAPAAIAAPTAADIVPYEPAILDPRTAHIQQLTVAAAVKDDCCSDSDNFIPQFDRLPPSDSQKNSPATLPSLLPICIAADDVSQCIELIYIPAPSVVETGSYDCSFDGTVVNAAKSTNPPDQKSGDAFAIPDESSFPSVPVEDDASVTTAALLSIMTELSEQRLLLKQQESEEEEAMMGLMSILSRGARDFDVAALPDLSIKSRAVVVLPNASSPATPMFDTVIISPECGAMAMPGYSASRAQKGPIHVTTQPRRPSSDGVLPPTMSTTRMTVPALVLPIGADEGPKPFRSTVLSVSAAAIPGAAAASARGAASSRSPRAKHTTATGPTLSSRAKLSPAAVPVLFLADQRAEHRSPGSPRGGLTVASYAASRARSLTTTVASPLPVVMEATPEIMVAAELQSDATDWLCTLGLQSALPAVEACPLWTEAAQSSPACRAAAVAGRSNLVVQLRLSLKALAVVRSADINAFKGLSVSEREVLLAGTRSVREEAGGLTAARSALEDNFREALGADSVPEPAPEVQAALDAAQAALRLFVPDAASAAVPTEAASPEQTVSLSNQRSPSEALVLHMLDAGIKPSVGDDAGGTANMPRDERRLSADFLRRGQGPRLPPGVTATRHCRPLLVKTLRRASPASASSGVKAKVQRLLQSRRLAAASVSGASSRAASVSGDAEAEGGLALGAVHPEPGRLQSNDPFAAALLAIEQDELQDGRPSLQWVMDASGVPWLAPLRAKMDGFGSGSAVRTLSPGADEDERGHSIAADDGDAMSNFSNDC